MPRINYYNKAGGKLPSVTTINKTVGFNENLIGWAHRMGSQGIAMKECRDRPADIGTMVHAKIDARLMRRKFDPDDVKVRSFFYEEDWKKITTYYKAWCRWYNRVDFELVEHEISLVSEELQVGGTMDCVAIIDGELSLVDYKCSPSIRVQSLMQLAAYGKLWEENFGVKIERYHLLRLKNDKGRFISNIYKDLGVYYRMFENAIAIYNDYYDAKKEVGYEWEG